MCRPQKLLAVSDVVVHLDRNDVFDACCKVDAVQEVPRWRNIGTQVLDVLFRDRKLLEVDTAEVASVANRNVCARFRDFVFAIDIEHLLSPLLKAVASPAGLEPATSDLEGRHSIQLSYGDKS